MAAPDNRLRVIVGNAPGARSGLWHIFTVGDNIYVQHAGMRKDLKTSLHASGANHVKWTPSGAARRKPDGARDREEGRAVLWTDLDPAGVAQMIEVGVEYGAR